MLMLTSEDCLYSMSKTSLIACGFMFTVFGEIDIDSDVPGAFGSEDRAFLQELARRIVPKSSASPSTWISA